MTDNSTRASEPKCPFCCSPMRETFLYVRGLGASLHESASSEVGAFSRKGLAQIDLTALSPSDTGSQAVLAALACDCGSVSFKTSQ